MKRRTSRPSVPSVRTIRPATRRRVAASLGRAVLRQSHQDVTHPAARANTVTKGKIVVNRGPRLQQTVISPVSQGLYATKRQGFVKRKSVSHPVGGEKFATKKQSHVKKSVIHLVRVMSSATRKQENVKRNVQCVSQGLFVTKRLGFVKRKSVSHHVRGVKFATKKKAHVKRSHHKSVIHHVIEMNGATWENVKQGHHHKSVIHHVRVMSSATRGQENVKRHVQSVSQGLYATKRQGFVKQKSVSHHVRGVKFATKKKVHVKRSHHQSVIHHVSQGLYATKCHWFVKRKSVSHLVRMVKFVTKKLLHVKIHQSVIPPVRRVKDVTCRLETVNQGHRPHQSVIHLVSQGLYATKCH